MPVNQTWVAPELLRLEPSNAAVAGASRTVMGSVTLAAGAPAVGVRVSFQVTGANSISPVQVVSDANGHLAFTYTGQNEGTDTVAAKLLAGGTALEATTMI